MSRIVSRPLRLVIVDDHLTFGRGLELLLTNAPGPIVEVVAVIDDAANAARVVEQHAADIALVDIQMPPPGGLGAIAAIAERVPSCAIVVLSGVEDPDIALAAFHAGAQAYLQKSAEPEDLIPPILAVRSGVSVMPAWLKDHLTAIPNHAAPDLSDLTEQEVQLLRLIATGADTSVIAGALHVSDRTAKRMISTTLGHLGVTTRIEAAVLATAAGLVTPRTRE